MNDRRQPARTRLAAVLEGGWLDACSALRSLARAPGFAVAAFLTLTVALALNVAVFAVMDSVLNRGFPLVADDDRLLYIQEVYPQGACCVTFADFADWQAEAESFDALAFVDGTTVTLSDSVGGRSVDIAAAAITANTFGVLGVQPALGRDFVVADEAPGAPRVAILSNRFWQTRFGGAADIVGRTIAIDGEPATVVGVMPATFDFPARQSLWLPLERNHELEQRTPNGYLAVGRLAPGATQESARAELTAINRRLAADHPDTNRGVLPRIDTYAEFFIGPDAPAVYRAAWVAAWFVLLIACANLANLTLARLNGRSRELATRLALGAARSRLGRQLLMESMLLAGMSAAAAWFLMRAMVSAWALATDSQYQIVDYGVHGAELGYLAAVALVAVAAFSAVPVARALRLRADLAGRASVRSTRNRSDQRFVASLVAVQMALAIVLLGGSGVLVRSLWNIVGADVGVRDADRVLIGWAAMPRSSLPVPAERAAFFAALRERLAAVPGVDSAAISNTRPVNVTLPQRFEIEGRVQNAETIEAVPVVAAGPDYFTTIGAATLAGREFGVADNASMPLTAIVNARFAAEYLGDDDPIGRRVRLYDGVAPGEWRTIVGVVANVMQSEPTRQRFASLVYLPFAQAPERGAWFFARAEAPSAGVAVAVRSAAESFHPDLSIAEFSTLADSFGFVRDRMDIAHAELGKYAMVAPVFAAVALLLAGIGLYAVVSYAVGQRTKEIGIRMAVGAASEDIRRLVYRRELVPVGAGLGIGLLLCFAGNRVIESQLVGVSPYDPLTLTLTSGLLLIVALLACQIPSQRALRVEPAVVLHDD
jgi:putative ABC transport system permease protein